jgi:hypothetical protein
MSDKIKTEDIIKVDEMERVALRNEMGIEPEVSYFNLDTNTVFTPHKFHRDGNNMSAEDKNFKIYPIIVDADNNIKNFSKNPPGKGGRRRKSRRRKSHRRKSRRRKSHRRRH